jgi:transposase
MHEVVLRDPNQVLLFMDPVHQIHNNENGYCWQFQGKKYTKQVKANTGRRRINIVGAINPVTLKPTALITESNCTEEVIMALLDEIKADYTLANTICIVLDNAKYQRSYAVQDYAKSINIDLLYLPPYCPNLNLIERLWKFFKKKVMKNKYYNSYIDFENAIIHFFQNFEIHKQELAKTLTFNFGIIKAN